MRGLTVEFRYKVEENLLSFHSLLLLFRSSSFYPFSRASTNSLYEQPRHLRGESSFETWTVY